MFIDTHLHISDTEGVSPSLYIENANTAGVNLLIASFCDKNDINLSTDFVDKYPSLYATIGFHPEFANSIVDNDYINLENTVKSNKKIIGIGEIGLDYYWVNDNKEVQKQVFEKQLSIAERLSIPVVIHSREATLDTIETLKKYSVKGIIHCFSGSVETAREYIKMGYLIGIGGVVTFKNSKLVDVVKEIPLESIVLETDSPYLSPEPNRGKINESSNIPYIARKIAEIKEIDASEVAEVTTKNAIRLFDLEV